MRLGCCASMIAPRSDPIGIEALEPLAAMGFDYIELSLAHLAALDEPDFATLVARVERSRLRCEACNNFFPPRLRLTGPAADLRAAIEYASAALERAARLGVSVIAFGSAGAKNVPDGFAHGAAWKQIVELLLALGPIAEGHGLTIAVEPISRPEANFVNLAAEGLRLVREVAHPNVQLLIDYFHLMNEGEDPRIMLEARGAIRHLHFARVEGRTFPTEWEAEYGPFFGLVNRIGYQDRCSIEAYTNDLATDVPRALEVLREATSRTVP